MKILSMMCALAVAAAAVARPALPATATDSDGAEYVRLAEKADRFFSHREWLNATAMYTLMLDREPARRATYAHDIVARYMVSDTVTAVGLVQTAMDHGVALDSLLDDISSVSRGVGSADMYERLLRQCVTRYPWLSRTFNGALLRYYDYRDNGPAIIRYAGIMLTGSPDNVAYQRLLARGYMLDDRAEAAVGVWQRILSDDPENLATLLDLGNYYYVSGDIDRALPYLSRAYALQPSPYLLRVIRSAK